MNYYITVKKSTMQFREFLEVSFLLDKEHIELD